MYKILDLFSGAGGFSLGFTKINDFDILVSIDNNEKLSETYIKNFPKVNHMHRNILSFTDNEIFQLDKHYNFDIIIGGPPCQGFSIAGKIGRIEKSDDRNNLFLGYLNFVKIIKPKIFIMENVARLVTHKKGLTLKNIEKEFNAIGYYLKVKILNASEYGVPQHRRRVFIIGTNVKNMFEFPDSSLFISQTISDAIEDLPKLKSGEKSNIPNHKAMSHSKQMLQKMSYVKDGQGRECIPENIRPQSGDVRKYIRYNSLQPSICITGDMRKVFHYYQNRALTCRELARIQTFPDDFIFYGNSINIQQQIGNAVPPKLAYEIAKKVKGYLTNEISKN